MTAPTKLDLFKDHKDEYVAPKKPTLVTVKSARYLAVEGKGAPGSAVFEEKAGALYSLAYSMKMASKKNGRDYAVCKLESLWWVSRGSFESTPREKWQWKLLIRTPSFLEERQRREALEQLAARGKEAGTDQVALESLREGRCVQLLHVGPYDGIGASVKTMQEFVASEGLEPHGRHHEIYLSDPRRVPAARLKTILRHPVRRA